MPFKHPIQSFIIDPAKVFYVGPVGWGWNIPYNGYSTNAIKITAVYIYLWQWLSSLPLIIISMLLLISTTMLENWAIYFKATWWLFQSSFITNGHEVGLVWAGIKNGRSSINCSCDAIWQRQLIETGMSCHPNKWGSRCLTIL